jgi:hypothetical protein
VSAHAQDFNQASELEFYKNPPSPEIFLKAPLCSDLREPLLALKQWTQSLGESPASLSSPQQEDSFCAVSLKGLLPQRVQALQGYKPISAGPNCWNTSLVTAKLIQKNRFSNPQEMSFWMNSPYCKKVGPNELLIAGDVMAMRTLPKNSASLQNFEESHGMIYITPQLVFSKNTSLKSFFELQSAHLIFQTFRVDDPQCFRNRGEGCSHWVDFYRCRSSYNDYALLKQRDVPFALLSEVIEGLEKSLSDYVMTGKPLEKDLPANESKLNELIPQVNQYLAQTPASDAIKIFFLKAHLETLESLKAQIRILVKN